jgi:hypothetical protein
MKGGKNKSDVVKMQMRNDDNSMCTISIMAQKNTRLSNNDDNA